MSNMRAIRTRIKSVESTRQITKSMKMVSASKLRKTQSAGTTLRGFADECGRVLAKVTAAGSTAGNPFLQSGENIRRVVYVLFVGNRGLCGVYNNSVLRYLEGLAAAETAETSVVVCGRWGREAIAASGLKVLRTFDEISDTPVSADAKELTEYLKQLYLSGEADRIVLVYQHFKSVLSQEPASKVLLPVTAEAEEAAGASDYIFEPDAESLLNTLVRLYIDNTLFSVMLEARTGEHASRMTAMTAATDNTDELIAQLNLSLNHARQAAITTEISEIVGGAAALNGD